MTNGTRANRTGWRFEAFVELALKEHGYKESSNGKDLFKCRAVVEGKYYAMHVNVGPTAYGGNSKRIVDALLLNRQIFPQGLIFECKWQQSSGSIDEKYPNLVNNIKTTEVPTIVVIGGNGYKPEAVAWLAKQVDGRNLLAVWTMEKFQIEVNNGFLDTGFVKPSSALSGLPKKQQNEKSLWDGIIL